jgi:hypothetical protein
MTLVVASVLNEAGRLRDVVLQEPGPSANLDASALDARSPSTSAFLPTARSMSSGRPVSPCAAPPPASPSQHR